MYVICPQINRIWGLLHPFCRWIDQESETGLRYANNKHLNDSGVWYLLFCVCACWGCMHVCVCFYYYNMLRNPFTSLQSKPRSSNDVLVSGLDSISRYRWGLDSQLPIKSWAFISKMSSWVSGIFLDEIIIHVYSFASARGWNVTSILTPALRTL